MNNQDVDQRNHTEETAAEFNEIAETIFAPIYPVIARQALECCGVESGFCIDAGCGPGHLALALASVSGFTIDALDLSHNMLACAEKNIRRAGLGERIRTIHGDVHALPYSDGSVDVVVSRGSVFFWNAPDRAFAEIYRVLKPGGRTFIGGGFGSPALKAAIIARMQEKNPSFLERVQGNMGPEKDAELRQCLKDAEIPDYEIIRDPSGFWVVMRK